MHEPTLIIWNASAGSARNHAALRAELEQWPHLTFHEAASGEEAARQACEAVGAGFALIVAAGGDGTVHAVVQGLATDLERARLGILPLGTGNDLCRTLGIPGDPIEAAAILKSDRERSIDLIVIESEGDRHYAVNMATAGNTSHIQEHLTDEMKTRWGPLAYLRGALEAVSDLTVYDVTLRLDERPPEKFAALNVVIANGRTSGGGFRAAPHANPEDGLLEVIVVLDSPPIDLAALAAKLALSNYLESEQVAYRRARRVEIETEPSLTFSLDGDLRQYRRAVFRVQPQALRVLVGPDYSPVPVGV